MPKLSLPRRLSNALVAIATMLAGFIPGASFAQANWPTKPIRLIVPFPAGGGTDIIARELRNKMSGTGWNIVVDNKPGSGGNIGVDAAVKAPPDGYTLVLGQTSNLAINPSLYSKLPYDPRKDLTAISTVASSPLVMVVAADSPYKTLADVVNAAKAKPDTLNYATSGNGTVAHLAMELFQREAGVKMTHIPYKGAAQGANDLIGGLVQLYTSSVPTLIGHIRNGRMRAIVVTSATRVTTFPMYLRSPNPATRGSKPPPGSGSSGRQECRRTWWPSSMPRSTRRWSFPTSGSGSVSKAQRSLADHRRNSPPSSTKK